MKTLFQLMCEIQMQKNENDQNLSEINWKHAIGAGLISAGLLGNNVNNQPANLSNTTNQQNVSKSQIKQNKEEIVNRALDLWGEKIGKEQLQTYTAETEKANNMFDWFTSQYNQIPTPQQLVNYIINYDNMADNTINKVEAQIDKLNIGVSAHDIYNFISSSTKKQPTPQSMLIYAKKLASMNNEQKIVELVYRKHHNNFSREEIKKVMDYMIDKFGKIPNEGTLTNRIYSMARPNKEIKKNQQNYYDQNKSNTFAVNPSEFKGHEDIEPEVSKESTAKIMKGLEPTNKIEERQWHEFMNFMHGSLGGDYMQTFRGQIARKLGSNTIDASDEISKEFLRKYLKGKNLPPLIQGQDINPQYNAHNYDTSKNKYKGFSIGLSTSPETYKNKGMSPYEILRHEIDHHLQGVPFSSFWRDNRGEEIHTLADGGLQVVMDQERIVKDKLSKWKNENPQASKREINTVERKIRSRVRIDKKYRQTITFPSGKKLSLNELGDFVRYGGIDPAGDIKVDVTTMMSKGVPVIKSLIYK